jgi:superfamily II DNA or RNA helicase
MSEVEFKITQQGRYMFIRPFPDKKFNDILDTHCSYERSNAQFIPNPMWRMVRLYNRKKSSFPIGLWNHVKCKLDQLGIKYEVEMTAQPPIFDAKLLEKVDKGLYPYQKEAVKALFDNNGGILQLPTGSGKTTTAIAFIKMLNKKTLVLVPTIDLRTQWEKQVPSNVKVITYAGMKSKSFLQDQEVIIYDECHHTPCRTLFKIGMNTTSTTINVGLSATPFMRDNDNMKAEAVLGRMVFKMTTRELIDKGYLCDAMVYYHPLKELKSVINDYQMTYNAYILNNDERNGKIVKIAKEAVGHVLILVGLIEHGQNLFDMLTAEGEDVVFLNGSVDKKDREDNMHKIVIATSIYDEGVDLPHLKVLILAAGGKSAIKVIQRVGRLLRKYPGKDMAIIHDFQDRCKWLVDHYKERRNLLEEDFVIVDVK